MILWLTVKNLGLIAQKKTKKATTFNFYNLINNPFNLDLLIYLRPGNSEENKIFWFWKRLNMYISIYNYRLLGYFKYCIYFFF